MDYTDQCSFYFSVFEKRSIEMKLEEFVGYICGERWKAQVLEYHRLMALGEKARAKKVKNSLPAMVIAGRCEGSHAEENLRQWSGDSMYDGDHCQGRALEFLQKLKAIPWVKAGWRSVSYDGVKLVVRIEAETTEEYRLAYAIVAWHISRAIDFPCDMSCKNPTRQCFASHDPEAFFKADAEVFPWRRFVKEHPEQVEQILTELKMKNPLVGEGNGKVIGGGILGQTEKSPADAAQAATFQNAAPSEPASSSGAASQAASFPANAASAPGSSSAAPSALPVPASGMLRTFFNDFLAHNAFIDGHKNESLLKLGRTARYKGLSAEELAQLKSLAVERLAGTDCSAADIAPRIDAGYRYADVHKAPESPRSKAHKAQGSPLYQFGAPQEEESAEKEKLEGDKLRKDVSYFPDELYDRLPEFLTRGLQLVRNKRERDILLMAMITNISGCLPGVRMNYANILYSADLYFIALAGSGRGKGVLDLANSLPNAIQNYYNELNKKEELEFECKLQEWNLEERMAAHEKRVPDMDKRPEAPKKHILKIAPNTSKSQLILSLEESGSVGLVMNGSELDMVSSAMHQDYGKFDEVYRAAFHHEEVSSYFKTDKRLIVAAEPHLSFCFSGTPGQLRAFVSSLENGTYNRIGFYIGQAKWSFNSAAPNKAKRDGRKLFAELSEELLRKFIFLLRSPTEVVFTKAQWDEHTELFQTYLQDVIAEDDDAPGAIVLRHGLIAVRVAMVLTALRKCEPEWNTSEWKCSDEDFRTAMQIVDVLLEHSLLLSTSVEDSHKEVKPLKSFFRIRPVLKVLSGEFTYAELVSTAQEMGIPLSTTKRYLSRLLEYKLLVKEGDKYKKTHRNWPK